MHGEIIQNMWSYVCFCMCAAFRRSLVTWKLARTGLWRFNYACWQTMSNVVSVEAEFWRNIVAAASVPENNFNFDNHPVEPDLVAWSLFILLLAILLSMLITFAKNVLTNADKIRQNPERYRLWTRYLRTASKCSILIGLIGSLLDIYRTFVLTAIGGDGFDKIVGPVGEALVFSILGLSIALIGYVLEFISRWKGIVAHTKI